MHLPQSDKSNDWPCVDKFSTDNKEVLYEEDVGERNGWQEREEGEAGVDR